MPFDDLTTEIFNIVRPLGPPRQGCKRRSKWPYVCCFHVCGGNRKLADNAGPDCAPELPLYFVSKGEFRERGLRNIVREAGYTQFLHAAPKSIRINLKNGGRPLGAIDFSFGLS